MPANGGLLRIGNRSPDSEFGHFRLEIADSLRPIFEIFPFSGDRDRRPGLIYTAWSSLQWNVVKFCALAAGSWEFRTYTARRTRPSSMSASLIGGLGSRAFRLSTSAVLMSRSCFSSESAHQGPCMGFSLSRSSPGGEAFLLRFLGSISKPVSSSRPAYR
jgi:hypothetical protein